MTLLTLCGSLIAGPDPASEDFRTDGTNPPPLVETQPVDVDDDFTLTTDWKLSRRPWAVFVGPEWPPSLGPDGAHRRSLEKAGFKIVRVDVPDDLPRHFRKVASKRHLLHLSWHDGTRRERWSPSDLEEASDHEFSQIVMELSRKSARRRLERLERRLSHCFQVMAHPKTGRKILELRLEELKEFARREPVNGLPELVQKIEVEVVDRNTRVDVRPTVAQLDDFRLVPVAADGIAGASNIELPGMSSRSVRTTVLAP